MGVFSVSSENDQGVSVQHALSTISFLMGSMMKCGDLGVSKIYGHCMALERVWEFVKQ